MLKTYRYNVIMLELLARLIISSMEKIKIIDKSELELIPRPTFTMVQLKEPYKLEPIVIKPL